MRKEDNSPQGKIVTELLQHLHACKNNCDVFYGREEELEKMKVGILSLILFVTDSILGVYHGSQPEAVRVVRRRRVRQVRPA